MVHDLNTINLSTEISMQLILVLKLVLILSCIGFSFINITAVFINYFPSKV